VGGGERGGRRRGREGEGKEEGKGRGGGGGGERGTSHHTGTTPLGPGFTLMYIKLPMYLLFIWCVTKLF
jgi:hypothetical protein